MNKAYFLANPEIWLKSRSVAQRFIVKTGNYIHVRGEPKVKSSSWWLFLLHCACQCEKKGLGTLIHLTLQIHMF